MAFPRLTAFSYWMYLAGGSLLWIAFVLNVGPDAGWFSYLPLAGPEYSDSVIVMPIGFRPFRLRKHPAYLDQKLSARLGSL